MSAAGAWIVLQHHAAHAAQSAQSAPLDRGVLWFAALVAVVAFVAGWANDRANRKQQKGSRG